MGPKSMGPKTMGPKTSGLKSARLLLFGLAAFGVTLFGIVGPAMAVDRTTLFIPLTRDSVAQELPPGVYADDAFGDLASEGWNAYLRVWKAHYREPSDPVIRRFLGLPLTESFEASARRGRTSPRWLGWRPGSFAQVDTPHFVIYSHASGEASKRVAEDLERCYWVWTQMFYPLWEAEAQVSSILGEMPPDESVKEFLAKHPGRVTIRRKLRVVLFRDAAEYQQTLAPENPGIERSTGFYHDDKQTTFLYAAETDDADTRRHEMVHQLFREATRSGLGRAKPAEDSGFWLIEGIAGYFESLFVGEDFATVGGWDASRLQFARYRMLVGGDMMPTNELEMDGRRAAQKRADIARWYAHAITQTHHLLDGGDVHHRQWVYRQLARHYKIRTTLPDNDAEIEFENVDRSTRDFLLIDDAHIIDNPIHRSLQRLCLAGCQVSEQGLATIPASADLRWLDLAGLPIRSDGIRRLAPRAASMEQLTLEATKIDGDFIQWLRGATSLRELDLSWTPMDDSAIDAIASADELTTLWMTGTKISDASIDTIAKLRRLEHVDLQRTKVTSAGIARLRAARPALQVNPLELRSPE